MHVDMGHASLCPSLAAFESSTGAGCRWSSYERRARNCATFNRSDGEQSAGGGGARAPDVVLPLPDRFSREVRTPGTDPLPPHSPAVLMLGCIVHVFSFLIAVAPAMLGILPLHQACHLRRPPPSLCCAVVFRMLSKLRPQNPFLASMLAADRLCQKMLKNAMLQLLMSCTPFRTHPLPGLFVPSIQPT